jgi:large subunit ribosomal protein L9
MKLKRKMKIILRADVERLGKIGSLVNVSPGFARNFLIPNNMAYPATEGNLKRIEFEKHRAAQLAEREKEEARQFAAKLGEVSLTFQVKVGEEDKLYGSVTSADISEEMLKQGFEIDKRKILIEEPIKALGVYSVGVRVHPEVTAEIKVWVVKE